MFFLWSDKRSFLFIFFFSAENISFDQLSSPFLFLHFLKLFLWSAKRPFFCQSRSVFFNDQLSGPFLFTIFLVSRQMFFLWSAKWSFFKMFLFFVSREMFFLWSSKRFFFIFVFFVNRKMYIKLIRMTEQDEKDVFIEFKFVIVTYDKVVYRYL